MEFTHPHQPPRTAQEDRQSGPDFQALFESLPCLYLVLDPSLKIIAVSNAYLAATMTKREEILGRGIFEVFPDNPDDSKASGVGNLYASLQRVLITKKPDTMAVQKYDIQKPASQGGGFEKRYWSPANTPVFGKNGDIICIVHRAEDVTEFVRLKSNRADEQKITDDLRSQAVRTEAEVFIRAQEIQEMNRQLIKSNEELEKKEKELTKARNVLQKNLASGKNDLVSLANDLHQAKDEALRASQVKSQFLANMSHEIRTPLGIILGFTELLLDPNLSAIERNDFVSRIRHSGQHLLSLLKDLLDLTKIEAGHIDVEDSDVSTHMLIGEIKAVLEASAEAKGLELQFRNFAKLPEKFIGDSTKLRQVLINLISNAIKFSEKGTVEVMAAIADAADGKEIRFTVKDNGPGIDPGYYGSLFEQFTQADSSMTRTHGGSGLGLALSRKLARAMGGDVELAHSDSRGSVFCLRIPFKEATATAKLPSKVVPLMKKPANGDALPGVRILAVDDAKDNLVLVRHFLEKVGAKVETANNGLEGVEKATHGSYDVILMDLQMPKLNGYEATSLLRSKGYQKPIIALTAHAMKEDQEKCMRNGCSDYLAKPIVAPILVKTIQKNLYESRAPSETARV